MSQVHQQHAITTFSTMLKLMQQTHLVMTAICFMRIAHCGICDNIARCSPEDANDSVMSLIKDNVIRRVPSYSGNYHYPVAHPAPKADCTVQEAAEDAYCEFNNKWENGYGANRIQQLRELVDYVTNNWDDELTREMTPATRVGIVKEITIVQRIADGDLFVLQHDDGSADPYFMPLGGTSDDRRSIDLRRIHILKTDNQPQRTVAEFIKEHSDKVAKRQAIESQLALLKEQIDSLKCEEAVLDYCLGMQHGVKRLNK